MKKYIALLLAGAMLTMSVSVGATENYENVNSSNVSLAADTTESGSAVGTDFQFGSSKTVLEEGTYTLPVSLMNATNIANASMAGSCVIGGSITVNKDGSAKAHVDLQSVTVGTLTGWANQWKVYQGSVDSTSVDAEATTDSEGHVTAIEFDIPDVTADGVYVNMYIDVMGYAPNGYLAFDYANAKKVVTETVNTGSATVKTFGYSVNVIVKSLENIITGVEITGNPSDNTSVSKLAAAVEVLKDSFNGLSTQDANAIDGIEGVTGATLSSDAIKEGVLNALDLTVENSNIPTEKLEEGKYSVDIAYTASRYSLVGDTTAPAILDVDSQGNITLTTDVICGTESAPLYVKSFNGYYGDNNTANELKTDAVVDMSDTDFSDEYLGEGDKIVSKVSFPLEGAYAESYTTNVTIYVPAMKNMTMNTGSMNIVNGSFAVDSVVTVDWATLSNYIEKPTEGTYSVNASYVASRYSLVGGASANDVVPTILNVDSEGNMTLTVDIVNGTESAPLYVTAFNGYYGDNDTANALKTDAEVVMGDTDFSDENIAENDKVVAQVTFPLEGNIAESYTTNVTIYVPAMKNMTMNTGSMNIVNGSFAVDSIVTIDWNSVTEINSGYEFGSAKTVLDVGSYNIPVSLMNANNIENASMAGSCVKSAVLTVNSDGSAKLKVELGSVSVATMTGWASQWKIYQNGLNSETVDAVATTDSEGHEVSIEFDIPDVNADGVYLNMYIDMMGYAPNAYLAIDYANAVAVGESVVNTYTGTAHIDQFGEYDVNVTITVTDGIITNIAIEGANFSGSFADYNKSKLEQAIESIVDKVIGLSSTDGDAIKNVEGVTGATYSVKAIKEAILNALNIALEEEVINVPTESLEAGVYTVDIAYYADGISHSLVENETIEATLTVDNEGNITLSTDVINGTDNEPLYVTAFNGYYADNDTGKELKTDADVSMGDTDFSDENFGENDKVVVGVSFPLEGAYAKTYATNTSIYVPAMKNLNGNINGFDFVNGQFDADCIVKVYWDSRVKVADVTSESTTESTTELTSESTSESTTELTSESTTESTTELTSESTSESTTELTSESTSESTTELTSESTSESTTELTSESTTELTSESTTESATETTTKRASSGSSGAGASSIKVSNYSATTTTEATTVEENTEETTESNTENSKSVGNVTVSIGSNVVTIDGQDYEMDAVAYIQSESNSTMVPLRFVALALSGENVANADNNSNISWNNNTKTATIVYGERVIQFTAGSNEIIVDGTTKTMDNGVVAEIVDGRMYVPFRALGEALDVSVSWNAETRSAVFSNN